jgi:hypothetical protein
MPSRRQSLALRHLVWRRQEAVVNHKRRVHLCVHTSEAPRVALSSWRDGESLFSCVPLLLLAHTALLGELLSECREDTQLPADPVTVVGCQHLVTFAVSAKQSAVSPCRSSGLASVHPRSENFWVPVLQPARQARHWEPQVTAAASSRERQSSIPTRLARFWPAVAPKDSREAQRAWTGGSEDPAKAFES